VCYCGLEFQFLSTAAQSKVSSRSTRSTFYVPNPPSPLGYNTYPAGKGAFSFVDNFQTYSGAKQDSYSKRAGFHSPKSSDRGGRLTAIHHLVQSSIMSGVKFSLSVYAFMAERGQIYLFILSFSHVVSCAEVSLLLFVSLFDSQSYKNATSVRMYDFESHETEFRKIRH